MIYRWKTEHRQGLAACGVAGGVGGLLLGYLVRDQASLTMAHWLSVRAGDAIGWAVCGAIIVSATVYAWRSFND
jgi:hypothetical protein